MFRPIENTRLVLVRWENGQMVGSNHLAIVHLPVCPIENILVVLSLSAAKPFFVFAAVVLFPHQPDGRPPFKDGASQKVDVEVSQFYCGSALRIAWVSSATAIRQNSNWDRVWTMPLRWSRMCSSVAAMSISFDPFVIRLRTMSMST